MKTNAYLSFRPRALGCALALAFSMSAQAAVSEQDAARLGKDLTPVGAEKAASKDGSIPAWDGGLSKSPAASTPTPPTSPSIRWTPRTWTGTPTGCPPARPR